MKKNNVVKFLMGIVAFLLLLLLITPFIVESLIGRKIAEKLSEKVQDYTVEIGKVHFSLIRSQIELENITIYSKQDSGADRKFKGEIASIKLKRIGLTKAIFKKDIDISEIIVSNTNIKGTLPFPEKTRPPVISSLNIRIDSIRFDRIELAIQNTTNAAAYSVKEGVLKISDFQVQKLDTLMPAIVKHFDFNATEILSVSADSMHTFTASGIRFSEISNTLLADSLSMHPNYKDYDYAARHKYQTDRIEATLSNVFLHDFSAAGYLKSKKLVSSYLEIGKMQVDVFRDKRKKFHHVNKPAFQDMIYDYAGPINIDSIGLQSGNVVYTEHGEKANEPGRMSFNKISAKIYKISNDTIYKTEKGFFKINAKALLMNKARITLLLKGRIFDRQNTISVNGTLSEMAVKVLNPMLEKNAFIYATSGIIDKMNFSFTADNSKASGKMILLYHDLNIAVKNKRTDDTTALKERVTSIIANIKILNSNPLPDKGVREGIIEYERDPERFVFNYFGKSILTGIKSSIVNSPKK